MGWTMRLRIHDILQRSAANGPGQRYVIWLQGCTLGCRDCFNPDTHERDGGRAVPVGDVLEDIRRQGDKIAGLTISGGEPFQQPDALLALVKAIRRTTGLSIIVFSGYRRDEIEQDATCAPVLKFIDVLVAGRYVPGKHLGQGMRGSSNQALHFLTSRHGQDDFDGVPVAEITIGEDGTLSLSGVQPPNLDASYLFKKFSGRPGRGHSMATNLPVDDRVI